MKAKTALQKRLAPLHLAAFLQGVGFWVPIEKLFMTEIGFDAATVGLMAAAYAAVVPLVEIPSGILADRWSRRGVLMLAGAALTLSALVMGVSDSVPVYILGASILGIYFAMYSGTLDSIVYDTVLEETGDGACFQRRIGRVRLLESAALVASALLGGWIAGIASTRLTYFLTVPFVAASLVALAVFREPTLHRTEEHVPLRRQIALTYTTIARGGRLVPIALLAVLTSLMMNLIFEFGPLWLVALSAAAVLYGPFWAALVSSIGLGGLLAGRLRLDRPLGLAAVVALMSVAGVALTTSHSLAVVAAAQVVLQVLIVTVSIHVSQLLHDGVPSTVRSGVASGIGALSWVVFVPISLVFGVVTKAVGVHTAGWMFVAVTMSVGALLVQVARRRPAAAETALVAATAC